MNLGIVLQLFYRSSRVQKKRAILTIAAIAWGTLSLLLLLAFGEGLGQSMRKARNGLGVNIAIIWPGETTMPWQGMPAGREIRPRIDDMRLLRERIPELLGIMTYRHLGEGPIRGLADFPRDEWPQNIAAHYYAYHIMVGLGTFFIVAMANAAWQLWRGRLFVARATLWSLLPAVLSAGP